MHPAGASIGIIDSQSANTNTTTSTAQLSIDTRCATDAGLVWSPTCGAQHCTAMHCNVLQINALHYTTQHNTLPPPKAWTRQGARHIISSQRSAQPRALGGRPPARAAMPLRCISRGRPMLFGALRRAQRGRVPRTDPSAGGARVCSEWRAAPSAGAQRGDNAQNAHTKPTRLAHSA